MSASRTGERINLFRSLQTKIILLLLIVSLIPLAGVGWFVFQASEQALRSQIEDQLVTLRNLKTKQLNDYFTQINNSIVLQSKSSLILDALQAFDSAYDSQVIESLDFSEPGLINLQPGTEYQVAHDRYHPILEAMVQAGGYQDLYLISSSGNVVYSYRKADDFATNLLNGDYRDTPPASLFQQLGAGDSQVSMTDFARYPVAGEEPVSFLGAPIRDDGEILGALIYTLPLSRIETLMRDQSNADQLDEIELLLVGSLGGGDYAVLAASSVGADGPVPRQNVNDQALQQALTGQAGIIQSHNGQDIPVLTAYQPVEVAGERWVMLAEIKESALVARLQPARNLILTALGLTFVAVLILGILLARRIIQPIDQLTKAHKAVIEGNLEQTVSIDRRDELGALGQAFNNSTTHLRNRITTLEDRIENRTRALETNTEISYQLTAILDLDPLLKYVIDCLQTEYNFYHSHIYLLEHDENKLNLAEGTNQTWASPAGPVHDIALDAPGSPIAYAARTREIVIIDNVHETSEWSSEFLLPNTQAEMAVPIMVGAAEVLVGVLDVQKNTVASFSDGDARLLKSLANQIGVAIHNARLYSMLQRELVERERAEAALQAANDELANRASKLEAQTEELARARDAAESASRAKSEFLANMSHELRTPLNGILGYAHILKQDVDLNKPQQEGLSIIQQNGDHLLNLINDILDLSKIEARKMEIDPSDFHLPNFLKSITEIYRIQAIQKNLTFRYEAAPTLPTGVHADQKRLRQILINLLDNAIKFTNKGEVIFKVSVVDELANSLRTRVIRFEIKDSGIGMTDEQIKKIFLPFEQVGDPSRRSEGTGLGLAISSRLAQLMGSELKVKSRPNRGAEFWFDVALPVLSAQEQEEVREELRHPKIVGYRGRYRKVLVIDHSTPNRKALANLLEPANFEVIEALNGEEGVLKLQTMWPDVALINLRLLAQLTTKNRQALQRLTGGNKIPLIVTSVTETDLDKHKELISTCQAFLPKRAPIDELFQTIQTQLELTWIYDKPGPEEAETTPYDSDQLKRMITAPPLEEMEVLFDLAMMGDMAGLEKRAEQLMLIDKKYIPFAAKLSKLAKSFEEEKALVLVEQYMENHE